MLNTLYPPFRKWSEVGTIWIYSDPHFSDEEMKFIRKNYIGDEEQIRKINERVGRKDTLIILGDIGDESKVKSLRGYKVLIKGNHDKGSSFYEEYFNEIYEGPLMIAEKIILSHEPLGIDFAFNIHGHDHSGWNNFHNSMNVCAEHISYSPVNLTDLIKHGVAKDVISIHRKTIDHATMRRKKNTD